jgi:uncharacterized protein with FMN-binding domain
MRRAPIVITATVLGTAGVLLFKPLAPTSLASSSTDGASGSGSSTSAGTGSSSSGTSSSGTSSSDSSSSGTSSSGTSSSGSASSGTSSSSGSTSTAKDGTYTGTAETVRFGTTQVKVTIAGGKITDVQTVQLNEDDPRSYSISESAAPVLRSEVLEKQTAAVDMVSGATYTSTQYEASLQTALDQAGFTASDGSKASTDVSSIEESGGFGH